MNQENRHIYPYEEALTASTEDFNGDTLAATVFLNKYAVKDSDGNLYESTPEEMHHRLAKEYARIEAKYPNGLSEEKIYSLLDRFKYFIPAGSPMNGIGNDFQKYVSLANCFILSAEGDDPKSNTGDSYNSIMMLDTFASAIMKRRGGVGITLNSFRSSNLPINNSALATSDDGIVQWMRRYSATTREVGQGKGRRGAMLLAISVKHPDCEKFIDSKLDLKEITGANISVMVTDEFMKCVEEDKPFVQQFPIYSDNPIIKQEISAKKLWDKIIKNAHKVAEPGVLFWDTVIRENPADCYVEEGFRTTGVNPCAEISANSSSKTIGTCNLSSVNLYSFVVNPFTKDAYFDFDKFKEVVRIGQRLLDDTIDLEIEKIDGIEKKIELDPEDEITKVWEKELWRRVKASHVLGRRTGLGITAEGDMIAAMGLKYGTPEATDFAVKVHKEFALTAYHSSVELAKERGTFQVYNEEKEKNNPFINRLKALDPILAEDIHKYGRRNIACLTIAPNGSVSLMTQTTSGIEPVFMPVYKRRRKVNPNDENVHVDFVDAVGDSYEEYIVFHPKFKTWMKIMGYDTEKRYTQKEVDDLVAKSPYAGATANEIDWKEKVRMQGEIQKFIDHSISVTINLPNNISVETVNELYVTAWKSGCKGCTIYRSGSRDGVILSISDDKKKEVDKKLPKVIEERPKTLDADVIRFKNNKENWIAFVGKLPDGSPYEIFTGIVDDEEGIIDIPKSVEHGQIVKHIDEDGIKSYDFEFTNKRGNKFIISSINKNFGEYCNYSKMLSSVLRYNMPMNYVFHLVDSLDLKDDGINSWKSGVKRALKKFIKDGTTVVGSNDRCPDCGEKLIFQDGCVLCPNCGYSKCG